MDKKKCVGIAGYMGAGKSKAACFLSSLFGAEILDADLLARDMILNNPTLIDVIGDRFSVVKDRQIDFRQLALRVFSDQNELRALNAITHPPLVALLRKKIAESTKTIILDAALLPLWDASDLCDCVLWICAQADIRVQRIMIRNNFDFSLANLRVKGQMDFFGEPKASPFWIHIMNNADEVSFEKSLTDVFNRVCNV